MEVLFIELVSQGSAEAVEVRHVEIVLFAECGELLIVGDRAELLVEIGKPFGRLVSDPLLIVKSEMVLAIALWSDSKP